MRGLMIASLASGGGKTVLTCGLLWALKARGLDLRAFKSGPDYIDPMFHSQVLGRPSRNLDLFLQGESGVRRTLGRSAGEFFLIEGAMGFYDGIGGTVRASAWDTACAADVPVVLVLRPQGASVTLAAQVRGLLDFRTPSRIAGLVLTACKPSLVDHLKPVLERETSLPVLGCLPPMEEASLPSRHLGLHTAGEIPDLTARFAAVGAQLERTLDLDALLSLAAEADVPAVREDRSTPLRCTIAVARDEAFCFCYADNLDALAQAGARPAFFSPLRDRALPAGTDGLYLPGGYPELYARRLSENTALREDVRAAVEAGLPTVAECGGFLYLQKTLEDGCGTVWPMAGVLPGAGFRTGRLQRFGYKHLECCEDSLLFRRGERVPAHEFHRWDCTAYSSVLTDRMYAGFPHLHFGGPLPLAERFAEQAAEWRRQRG